MNQEESRPESATSSLPPNRRKVMLWLGAGFAWLAQHSLAVADDLITLRKGRRRIAPLCALPMQDYQHHARTPSVIVRSHFTLRRYSEADVEQTITAIRKNGENIAKLQHRLDQNAEITPEQYLRFSDELLMRELEGRRLIEESTVPRSKLIQIASEDITIAHCRVRDIAMRIEPNGNWRVSLKADQNYLRDDASRERNLDLQLKRNAFNVTIRLLSSSRASGENLSPSVGSEDRTYQAGKLVLAVIEIPEFWVQREAPRSIVETGNNQDIAQGFLDIEQAEFEIFIRLDPLTGNGKGVVQPWQQEP